MAAEDETSKKLKEICWLLYVCLKHELFGARYEIVDLACLLIPLFTFVVSSAPKFTADTSSATAAGSITETKQKLFKLFQIKSETALEPLFASFDAALQKTMATVQVTTPETFWENPAKFDSRAKALETLAKAGCTNPNLDETMFVKESVEFNPSPPQPTESIVNVRVTPIKLKADPVAPRPETRSELRPEIATVSTPQKCGITLSTKLHEISSPGYNIPCRTVSSEFTPVTSTLSMNSWLQDALDKPCLADNGISMKLNKMLGENAGMKKWLLKLIESVTQKVTSSIDSDTKLQCLNLQKTPLASQIRLFYFHVVEILIDTEERKAKKSPVETILSCEDFHKGVIVAACETILFIHNIISLKLEDLLETVAVSAFDFWKILPSFLRLEPPLPAMLFQHFQEVEKKILAFLAWQKGSPLCTLIADFLASEAPAQLPENTGAVANSGNGANGTVATAAKQKLVAAGEKPKISTSHQLFFKKVLQLVATLILEVTREMKISDWSVKEKIWEATKYCLSTQTDLLVERHLVHVLLCSVYAVCKAEEIQKKMVNPEYKFNNIIQCYLRSNGDAGNFLCNMFHLVKISETNWVNIIEFYNKCYLPKMQDPVLKICSGIVPKSKPGAAVKPLAPASPLREALPRKCSMHGAGKTVATPLTPSKPGTIMMSSPLGVGKVAAGLTPKVTPKATPKLTPRTQAMFICSESPMLKTKLENRKSDMRGFLRRQILDQSQPSSNSIDHFSCLVFEGWANNQLFFR